MAEIRRGTFIADERNNPRSLGHWLWPRDAAPDGLLGQVKAAYEVAVKTAQKRHEQNFHVLESKAKSLAPMLPEPKVREAVARKMMHELREAMSAVETVRINEKIERLKLIGQVFNPEAGGLHGILSRQELRTLVRNTADARARAELLKHVEVVKAVGEALPELSGLSEALHAKIVDEEVRRYHGDAMATLDHVVEAVEVTRGAIREVQLSCEAELAAISVPLHEAAPPQETATWVA